MFFRAVKQVLILLDPLIREVINAIYHLPNNVDYGMQIYSDC